MGEEIRHTTLAQALCMDEGGLGHMLPAGLALVCLPIALGVKRLLEE